MNRKELIKIDLKKGGKLQKKEEFLFNNGWEDVCIHYLENKRLRCFYFLWRCRI